MIDKTALVTALRSPKTRKYGLRALVVFCAIGVIGFFVLPLVVKSLLLENLGEALHRPVSVQRVSINP
jgi:TctA family transporter